jgi:hypothetical protein
MPNSLAQSYCFALTFIEASHALRKGKVNGTYCLPMKPRFRWTTELAIIINYPI